MIVVVCLNPALDVTLFVDALRPGSSHRVRASVERAGGKGINVARVLRQLDAPVLLTGIVGGRRGAVLADEITAAGISADLVEIADDTRRSVAVVADDGEATVLNEPGPDLSDDEWARFLTTFDALAAGASTIVLSGSLPPGAPADAYADLVRRSHGHHARALVDAEGDALRHALAAAPDLVKPNEHEAAPFAAPEGTVLDGLLAAGAANAVVSLGADGLVARLDGRSFRARLATPVTGNPTGAGDTLAAVLATGLSDPSTAWAETVRTAVAASAAAVVVPHAGEFDVDTAQRLRPLVELQEEPCR